MLNDLVLIKKGIPLEVKTEVKDGILIEKSVLYNRETQEEVILHETKIVIADEVAKIDEQIAELTAKKKDYIAQEKLAETITK